MAVALLMTALVALAVAPLALPASYDWVRHGTSESAAQGIDGAWVARTGFILFGLAVLRLAHRNARRWGTSGTVAHAAFGVSMLAVAAFSTRPWNHTLPYVRSEDTLHTFFATTMGFGFIAGVLAVAAKRPRRDLRSLWPDAVAIAVAICVPLTMASSVWGILQRLMFLVAAGWYGREAWRTDPLRGTTTA